MMLDPLQVDPIDLFLSADHLNMYRADHQELHTQAHTSIEAAGSGWVGSSAAALQEKIPALQAVAAHIGSELAHHRDAFRQAGHRYQNTDSDGAGAITSLSDSL